MKFNFDFNINNHFSRNLSNRTNIRISDKLVFLRYFSHILQKKKKKFLKNILLTQDITHYHLISCRKSVGCGKPSHVIVVVCFSWLKMLRNLLFSSFTSSFQQKGLALYKKACVILIMFFKKNKCSWGTICCKLNTLLKVKIFMCGQLFFVVIMLLGNKTYTVRKPVSP